MRSRRRRSRRRRRRRKRKRRRRRRRRKRRRRRRRRRRRKGEGGGGNWISFRHGCRPDIIYLSWLTGRKNPSSFLPSFVTFGERMITHTRTHTLIYCDRYEWVGREARDIYKTHIIKSTFSKYKELCESRGGRP